MDPNANTEGAQNPVPLAQGQPTQSTDPTATQVQQVLPPAQYPSKKLTIKHWTKKGFAIAMRIFFFLLPLETAYTILAPYLQTKILLLVLGLFAVVLAFVLSTKMFFRILQFFAIAHVAFILYSGMRPYTAEENFKIALSDRIFAQPNAIALFTEAYFSGSTNTFIFLGPSGVGKTSAANHIAKLLAKDPWTNNLFVYRLTRLSSMQNAIMLADTKNLFDPAKRGSIAFDIEGRPDCYLSVCVVVLDDFHLFSFQEPALASKLLAHLHRYATTHPKVVFIVVVESTSIIENNPEVSNRMNKFLVDLHLYGNPGFQVQEQELNEMLVRQVPSFRNLPNYKLLPFASLNDHRRDWENLLFEATKKKLQAFTLNSQLIIHNIYSYANIEHGIGTSEIVSVSPSQDTNIPIYVSDEVVREILHSAFSVEQKTETAPGMRSIEQLWSPQIHYAIKKYYSARSKMIGLEDSSSSFCSGYLSIELTTSKNTPKTVPKLGDVESETGKWKGRDIVCKCEPSIISQWALETRSSLESIRWDEYLPFVVNVRNALAALEKILTYW